MLRLQDIVEAQKSLLRFRECFALFFLKGIPLDMGYLCIYLFILAYVFISQGRKFLVL